MIENCKVICSYQLLDCFRIKEIGSTDVLVEESCRVMGSEAYYILMECDFL